MTGRPISGHWMRVEDRNPIAWPDHAVEASTAGDVGLVLLREALAGDDEALIEAVDAFECAWRHALIDVLSREWIPGDPDRRTRSLLVDHERRIAVLNGRTQ